MVRMSIMDNKPHPIFSVRQSLRCHPRAKKALKRLVNRLVDYGMLKFRGEDATQEAIVSAIWLAVEDMVGDAAGLERAVKWIEPHLSRIEELAGKGDVPAGRAANEPGDVMPDAKVWNGESTFPPLNSPPSRRRGQR